MSNDTTSEKKKSEKKANGKGIAPAEATSAEAAPVASESAPESAPSLAFGPDGWRLPAIRGVMAGREYFVVMVTLRDVDRLLAEVNGEVSPELRAQRQLNETRVQGLVRYLVGNPDAYVLPPLVGTIDGYPDFEPAADGARVGALRIGLDVTIESLDGQHRRAAVGEAIRVQRAQQRANPKWRPDGKVYLEFETVPVVLFVDPTLARRQQMFADINGKGARVAGSLALLYDHRDEGANLARHVCKEIPTLGAIVEGEKGACGGKSPKLFTNKALHDATEELVGNVPQAQAKKIAVAFWRAVVGAFPAWAKCAEMSKSPETKGTEPGSAPDLRAQFIWAHSVGLHAIARVGAGLVGKDGWEATVAKLNAGAIDWQRKNKAWESRATVPGTGEMAKSRANVARAATHIKRCLGLDLTPEDLRFESIEEQRAYDAERGE